MDPEPPDTEKPDASRKRRQLPLLTLVFALALAPALTLAQGVKLPLLSDTLSGGERQQLPQPTPTELVPGWWHYFDAEGDKLQQRIDDTVADLNQLLDTIPEASASLSDAKALVELITSSLKTLPEARAKRSAQVPPTPVYATRYSPPQLLALARQLRDLKAEVAIEEIDYGIAESDLQDSLRRNDTDFAAYLNLATSDPRRAIKGLQLMAERLSLGVAQERLRLRRAELEANQVRVRQLSDKLAEAKTRLSAEDATLTQLEAKIVVAEKALEQARAGVVQAQANASSVIGDGDSAEEKAQEQYRQQQVVAAQIAEATAETELLTLRAERALTRLLLDSDTISYSVLYDRLTDWREQLDTVSEQLTVWTSASERERRRTGTAAGGANPRDAATAGYVAFLNQDRFALAQETLVAIEGLRDRIQQARLVIELVNDQLTKREGVFVRGLAYIQQGLRQAWQNASDWTHVSLFTIGDTPVTAIGLLRIVLIITLAWWLSHWIRRVLGQLGERSDSNSLPAFYTIGRLSHYLLILLGVLIGLSSIGMDFTSFALVAGALAIGIGFGLQAIVNNFISGLILLFERSLKVGDFVELGNGVAGEVRAINVRSTQIKTNENIDIVVPNSEFMNTNVINWTLQEPYMRVHYPFRVAFGADKERVRKAGLEAAENVTHTLSGIPGKNPQVWLVEFGENGYTFELVVWLTPSAVKRPSAVKAAYYWELETALKKYEIKVPVPQRDLYLRGGFENGLAAPTPEREPTPLAVPPAQEPVPLRPLGTGD